MTLIVSGLLTIIFSLVGIFSVFVAGSISSTCTEINNVLNSDNPGDVFSTAGIVLTDDE